MPSVAAHPLARLHRAGVPVTLNTDDTTVSDITLSEEYVRAVETIGLTLPELWAIDRRALDVAFADEAVLDTAAVGVRRTGPPGSRSSKRPPAAALSDAQPSASRSSAAASSAASAAIAVGRSVGGQRRRPRPGS